MSAQDEEGREKADARVRGLVGKGEELVVRPPARILCLGPMRIEKHHREPSHTLARTERLVLLTVHFGHVELVLHPSTELGPCRRQLLAVATPGRGQHARARERVSLPGCEKLDERGSLGEEAVKGLYVERDDRARRVWVRAGGLYDERLLGGRRRRRRRCLLFRRRWRGALWFRMLFQKLDQEMELSVSLELFHELAVAV